jgi:hypothetical protein
MRPSLKAFGNREYDMALFFGKIKPGGEPSGQLENAFYFSPDGDQRFNGILPGDHSYIISGRLIQLWQAERWEQVEGGKRLCFRKVIEDIGLRVGGFMALRFFKVTNQLTVFSVRSSRRKAFFPIELAEPFPAEVMNDPATYRNPENFRRIAYFPVAPESASRPFTSKCSTKMADSPS